VSSLILWNNGDGTFTRENLDTSNGLHIAYSAAYGDLNCDGWPDIVTVDQRVARVYLNCRSGGAVVFREAPNVLVAEFHTPLGVLVDDFDGDGDLDIAVSQGDHGAEIPNLMFLNQINGCSPGGCSGQ
jgi:hypothetical protein